MLGFELMLLFCTVGTTAFDGLVALLLRPASLAVIRQLGYTRLVVQVGRGVNAEPPAADVPAGLTVEVYDFKPSLAADVAAADLVVSHAGAGSIMEALRAGKRLVVVVNEALMGNHQSELAEALGEAGHLRHATCDTFLSVLTCAGDALKAYPDADPGAFAALLDSEMGVV